MANACIMLVFGDQFNLKLKRHVFQLHMVLSTWRPESHRAPECVVCGIVGTSSDIYALGQIMLQ